MTPELFEKLWPTAYDLLLKLGVPQGHIDNLTFADFPKEEEESIYFYAFFESVHTPPLQVAVWYVEGHLLLSIDSAPNEDDKDCHFHIFQSEDGEVRVEMEDIFETLPNSSEYGTPTGWPEDYEPPRLFLPITPEDVRRLALDSLTRKKPLSEFKKHILLHLLTN